MFFLFAIDQRKSFNLSMLRSSKCGNEDDEYADKRDDEMNGMVYIVENEISLS